MMVRLRNFFFVRILVQTLFSIIPKPNVSFSILTCSPAVIVDKRLVERVRRDRRHGMFDFVRALLEEEPKL